MRIWHFCDNLTSNIMANYHEKELCSPVIICHYWTPITIHSLFDRYSQLV